MSVKRVCSFLFVSALFLLSLSACAFGGAPASDSPSSTPGAGVSVAGATSTPAPATSATSAPADISPTNIPAPIQTAIASLPTVISSTPVASTGDTRVVTKLSNGLEKLRSYRAQFSLGFDGVDKNNTSQKGTLAFLRENNNEKKDQHVKLSSTGDLTTVFGGGAGSVGGGLELYHVADNTFTVQGGKCQFIGSGDSSISNTPIFNPDEFFGSMNNAVLVARSEQVNGVAANHYQVKNTKMASAGMEGFTISQADIWITLDDYVVKATGSATGTTKTGATGTATLNYNIDQINALPAIQLPADCVAPVAAADVPLPPNITGKTLVTANGATLITFKTTDTAKVIGDFFVKQLPPVGWKLEGDQTNPLGRALNFSKDGGKRTLTINYIMIGGSNTVTVTDKATK